jgi:hypothetical protein
MTQPLAKQLNHADALCVVFECAPWAFAVPTRWLTGLLTVDEGQLWAGGARGETRTAGDPRGPVARHALLLVGARWFAAWDFGVMMNLPPLQHAWLLMLVPHGGQEVPVALRVGHCSSVETFEGAVSLPAGLFRERRQAFGQCFSFNPASTSPGATALVGLMLNPAGLWTSEELVSSAHRVAEVSRANR